MPGAHFPASQPRQKAPARFQRNWGPRVERQSQYLVPPTPPGAGGDHVCPGALRWKAQCQILMSPSQEQVARTEGSTGWKVVPTQACVCPCSVRARLAVRKQ